MTDRRAHILIVDDDRDILANIRDILDDLGYQADTAHDGPSALDLVEAHSYDLALLDYQMPGMDGAELYREIKKRRPEMAAIMITAFAGSNGAQRAMDEGTWQVLRKPVDLNKLLPLVEQATNAPLVLLVDDDHEFCETLWQFMTERRYRVSIAHSGEEGLGKARSLDCDVAIIDLHLDNGDARDILAQVRAANPHAKSILVTGDRTISTAELVSEGLDGICFKPIELSELMTAIGA